MAKTRSPTETKTRYIELSDGQQSKLTKVSLDCTLQSLLKEGKNKFRRTFQHVLYRLPNTPDQRILNDQDLGQILDIDRGRPCFLLCDKVNHMESPELKMPGQTCSGVSFILAHESDTDPSAVSQLERASQLPGCIFAIGMPDLHAGKGIPIGAVVMTEESVAYPQLVDSDIGCGMSWVVTSLSGGGKLSINKLQKLANHMESIDGPFASTAELMKLCAQPMQWATRLVEPLPVLPDKLHEHYKTLGTVGGRNHFAELQEFDEIMDPESLVRYGIDTTKVYLLVHSGSRSLGAQYLHDFLQRALHDNSMTTSSTHGHYAADTNSPLFQEYLKNHHTALNFAMRNRQLIARRLLEQLTGHTEEPVCKIDIHHNFLERIELNHLHVLKKMTEQGNFPKDIPSAMDPKPGVDHDKKVGWIHRKGATPTTESPILVIPGSRGSLSYLVEVNPNLQHGCGYSLAHGAGRRMTRSKARALHQAQYPNAQQLLQTDLGGVVVCEKKDLVYEEAPTSYKDIDNVIKCLANDVRGENGGLVRILATLRPILTYKYKDPYNRR